MTVRRAYICTGKQAPSLIVRRVSLADTGQQAHLHLLDDSVSVLRDAGPRGRSSFTLHPTDPQHELSSLIASVPRILLEDRASERYGVCAEPAVVSDALTTSSSYLSDEARADAEHCCLSFSLLQPRNCPDTAVHLILRVAIPQPLLEPDERERRCCLFWRQPQSSKLPRRLDCSSRLE